MNIQLRGNWSLLTSEYNCLRERESESNVTGSVLNSLFLVFMVQLNILGIQKVNLQHSEAI